MIDLHNHILPGVDDGAHHMTMALRMLEIAAAQGITHVVCTPHLNDWTRHVQESDVQRVFGELKEAAFANGIPVELGLASEIMLSPSLLETLANRRSATYFGRGSYFLLEFPAEIPFEIILNAVKAARRREYFPLLAHFERYPRAMREPEQTAELKSAGAILTMDAGSLTGQFGPVIEKRALKLMEWGCIDILASDAHDDDQHGFCLKAGREAAAQLVGPAAADRMVRDHPRRVWEGKEWEKALEQVSSNANRPA